MCLRIVTIPTVKEKTSRENKPAIFNIGEYSCIKKIIKNKIKNGRSNTI